MNMPLITVSGAGTYNVESGKRLLLAITDDAGIDQLHLCGGKAICATCTVTFDAGEPEAMTVAERDKLHEKGLDAGIRLACQMTCTDDMHLSVLEHVSTTDKPNAPGPRASDAIMPEPTWVT